MSPNYLVKRKRSFVRSV